MIEGCTPFSLQLWQVHCRTLIPPSLPIQKIIVQVLWLAKDHWLVSLLALCCTS